MWNSFKNCIFLCTARFPCHKVNGQMKICLLRCVFSWVGAVIGLASWVVYQAGGWLADRQETLSSGIPGSSNLFLTMLLVLIPIFITGGIHLDGFLDTQDALSSYQPMERRLEILKDSHAGAFAIISCSVYFFAYTGIYSMLTAHAAKVIAISFMLSRTLSGLSVICFPQARKKKTGACGNIFQKVRKKE